MSELQIKTTQNNSNPKEDATTKEPTAAQVEAAKKAELEAELDAEYTENKKIVVAVINRVSAYRAINALAIGKPKYVIGSSISSTRKLMSNKGELETYYPELLGVSSNNPDFVTRVKKYLSNISVNLSDGQKEFDVSFVYRHKRLSSY